MKVDQPDGDRKFLCSSLYPVGQDVLIQATFNLNYRDPLERVVQYRSLGVAVISLSHDSTQLFSIFSIRTDPIDGSILTQEVVLFV